MLDRRDISKYTKPLIIALGLKTISLLVLVVFLPANSLTGFTLNISTVSHCDNYFNTKVTLYQNHILMAQFIMILIAFIGSSISLVLFVTFVVRLIKQQKQKLKQIKRLSENRVKAHFILSFVESICIITILTRTFQKTHQHSACNTQDMTKIFVVLSCSILTIIALFFTVFILFRLLSLIQQKLKALEQYIFYSDQITLQENLLFNKTGYIKELIKMQDYTSRSSDMKDEPAKNTYSGYKANVDLSPKRQIIYKLRGGHMQNFGAAVSNKSNPRIPQQQNQGETSNNNQLNRSRFNENASQQGKPLHFNLMAVGNDQTMDQTPNDQSFQYVQLTHNVIDLAVDKGYLQDLNEESDYQSQKQESQDYEYQKAVMKKNGLATPKKEQDIALQHKIQDELRHKFNLTPNTELRRRYAHKRNDQNIDDHGNYLFVDVDKIKKRSKLLNFNEEANNVDPNALYAREEQKSLTVRQKRLPKKHEKYVTEYLKKLNKLKKEQVLFKEQPSSIQEDFDESSEQSSSYDEDEESSQVVDTIPITIVDPVTGQSTTVIPENKKNKKNQAPQLYLYIKKKKNQGTNNKLKLFQDFQGFYDSEDQKFNENRQEDRLNGAQKGLGQANLNSMLISGNSKDHQGQKSKHDQKVVLTNKQLDNDEAKMLRFIRKKYISKGQQNEIHENRQVFPPGMNGQEGHPQNYDPNDKSNQSMIHSLNGMMTQNQQVNPNQGSNQHGQPNGNKQPYQNGSIQGNIFAPPHQNSQISPIKNNSGLSAYHMMSPQPNSQSSPIPFNLQTPLPLSQSNYNNNQTPPPNYPIQSQNIPIPQQPNYMMGSNMQSNTTPYNQPSPK